MENPGNLWYRLMWRGGEKKPIEYGPPSEKFLNRIGHATGGADADVDTDTDAECL